MDTEEITNMSQVWDPRNTGVPTGAPQQPFNGQMGHAQYPGAGYPNQGYAPQPQAEMPDLTEEVSLNDEVEFEALAPLPEQAVGENIRFSFLIFDEAGDIRMRTGNMFYGRIGEKRFPFLAPPDSHPLFARCVDKWNMPKKRMGAIVLAYNCDKEGNLIPGDTFRYHLHVLHFNDVTAKWFRSQNKRYPFRQRDLMRTGTKATQFGVEYSYSVEPESVFSMLPAEKRAEIMEKAHVLHSKYLGPSIGRPRPDVEIEDLLRDIDPTLRRQGGGQPQQQVNPWAAAPGYQGFVPPQFQGQAPMQQLPYQGQPQYQPHPQQGYQAPYQPPQQAVSPQQAGDAFGRQLAAASQQGQVEAPAETSAKEGGEHA